MRSVPRRRVRLCPKRARRKGRGGRRGKGGVVIAAVAVGVGQPHDAPGRPARSGGRSRLLVELDHPESAVGTPIDRHRPMRSGSSAANSRVKPGGTRNVRPRVSREAGQRCCGLGDAMPDRARHEEHATESFPSSRHARMVGERRVVSRPGPCVPGWTFNAQRSALNAQCSTCNVWLLTRLVSTASMFANSR